jgi:Bacterial EndoU nuclease
MSPETAEKILRGTRNAKGDLIGVHSAEVLDHPNFAANALKTNPDGTIEAEVVKQYSDGTLSQVKKSTLAPISWDNAKIISATEEVGGGPAAGVRVQDRATCHMGEIDGVKWITIRDSSGNVTAGYPNPSGAKPGDFK